MALRSRFPKGTDIIGLIVVCCCDGAKMYNVKPMYTNETLFGGAPTAIKAIKGTFSSHANRESFPALPEFKSAQQDIMKTMARYGYTSIDAKYGRRYGSFVAHNNAKTSFVVVGLVHVETVTATISHSKHAQLLLDGRALWLSLKQKFPVRTCVFYYGTVPLPPKGEPFRAELIGSTYMAVKPKPKPPKKKRVSKKKKK